MWLSWVSPMLLTDLILFLGLMGQKYSLGCSLGCTDTTVALLWYDCLAHGHKEVIQVPHLASCHMMGLHGTTHNCCTALLFCWTVLKQTARHHGITCQNLTLKALHRYSGNYNSFVRSGSEGCLIWHSLIIQSYVMLVLFFIAQPVFLCSGGRSLLLTPEKCLFVPLLLCMGRAHAHGPLQWQSQGAMTFITGAVMSSQQWHHLQTGVLFVNKRPPLDSCN